MPLILEKNVPLNLEKETIDPVTKEITTTPLTNIQIGAGWDLPTRGQGVDLDLVLSTNTKQVCYYNNLSLFDGAVKHCGDNRTGKGEGADETINVDLTKLPDNVTELEVAVSSFNGFNFQDIQNEFVQIVDLTTNNVIAKSKDNLGGSGQTLILAKLVKTNNLWSVTVQNKVTGQNCREYLQSKV